MLGLHDQAAEKECCWAMPMDMLLYAYSAYRPEVLVVSVMAPCEGVNSKWVVMMFGLK